MKCTKFIFLKKDNELNNKLDNRTVLGLILKAEPTRLSKIQFIRKSRHVSTE